MIKKIFRLNCQFVILFMLTYCNSTIKDQNLLYKSINNNNLSLSLILIKNKISLEELPIYRFQNNKTALHIAVENNNREALLTYIQSNVPINTRDNDGETPLLLAVKLNFLDMVELLLIKGANPNIPNNDNITPLQQAIKNNDINQTELLKQYT